MPLDATNPRIINFLTESYEKEATSRKHWIYKHKEKLQKAATFIKPTKNYVESDVLAYNMAEGLSATNRDYISAAQNRRKVPLNDTSFIQGVKHQRRGHSIVDVGLGDPNEDPRLVKTDDDLTLDPVMRPVSSEIDKIRIEEGCKKYLHERVKLLPENRYYFAECVNWDYGWRLKDSSGSRRAVHGRQTLLMRILNDRVGPQPDPPHYKAVDILEADKCKNS